MSKTNSNPYNDFMAEIAKTKGKHLSRFGLPRTAGIQSFDELIADGNKILEEEQKLQNPCQEIPIKNKPSTLDTHSTNPYVKARNDILNEMTPEKRNVILKMENGQLEKDSRYENFCNDIRKLGDKLSNNN